MTIIRKVRLEGGHFDGEHVEIRAGQRLKTLEWEQEQLFRDWDGTTVWATRTGLDTYRQTDDPFVFALVETPGGIHGDTVTEEEWW